VDDGKSTFIGRLLTGFKSDTDRLVKEITSALTERRYEEIRNSAHALKGGAASVGATQLSQLARKFENASPESFRLRTGQWIEELLKTAQTTVEMLESYLAEHASSRPSASGSPK